MSQNKEVTPRQRIESYLAHGTRLVEECNRFLALDDETLERAFAGKVKKHYGWGDSKSPGRYLEP